MYKRHLISALIGIRHSITLRGSLSINRVNNEGDREISPVPSCDCIEQSRLPRMDSVQPSKTN